MVLHFVKLTKALLGSVESLYWIIVNWHYANFTGFYRCLWCTQVHPFGNKKTDLMLVFQRQKDALALTLPLHFYFKQRLHCSCLRRAHCVQVWGFAQGVPTLSCPPTQVIYCSHGMDPLLQLAGNLSMICRKDCHCVGRSGCSASAPTTSSEHRQVFVNIVPSLNVNVAF